MKYFLGKYWEMMNSDDPDIQNKGGKAWIEMAESYSAYFETIKSKLPKGFLKVFEKNNWFHDCEITSVNLINTKKSSSIVEFRIKIKNAAFKLKLTGVKKFKVDIPTTQNWMCGMLTWGYTEFELNDDNSWSIHILCDFDNEIAVSFKRISIAKVNPEA